MVRHYSPHSFPGHLQTNSDYLPQSDNQGSIPGQNEMEFNGLPLQMLFNNTNEEMEYN